MLKKLSNTLKQALELTVRRLLKINSKQFVLFFLFAAMAFSAIIVVAIDLLWDRKFNSELQFAGIVTPFLVGLLLIVLITAMLNALRKEMSRRESTERILKEAQRIAKIGNWALDLKTGELTWSEEIYRIFEIDPRQFAASYAAFLNAIHPEDREMVNLTFTESLKSKQPYTIEHRLLMKDGRIKYVHEQSETAYDSHGNPLYSIGTVHDITDRKIAEDEIRTLAFYDSLTKLPNRRLLNDRLGQALSASKRHGHYGALMFLNLDNFKSLNDTHGHNAGDMLLIEAAKRISSCVREVDTVVRFGGDEYVVMIGELDADKAASIARAGVVAEKIRAALAEPYLLTYPQAGNATSTIKHHCTSSIGVMVFNHENSQDDILMWADTAMYQAKEDGRNLIRFHAHPTGG